MPGVSPQPWERPHVALGRQWSVCAPCHQAVLLRGSDQGPHARAPGRAVTGGLAGGAGALWVTPVISFQSDSVRAWLCPSVKSFASQGTPLKLSQLRERGGRLLALSLGKTRAWPRAGVLTRPRAQSQRAELRVDPGDWGCPWGWGGRSAPLETSAPGVGVNRCTAPPRVCLQRVGVQARGRHGWEES